MMNKKSLPTGDNTTKSNKWWKNKDFINKLDKRYSAWESGKEKGYTLEEVNSLFEIAKKKRNNFT